MTKSSPSIWHYVVSVKSTVKISSIFVAFSEYTNFTSSCWSKCFNRVKFVLFHEGCLPALYYGYSFASMNLVWGNRVTVQITNGFHLKKNQSEIMRNCVKLCESMWNYMCEINKEKISTYLLRKKVFVLMLHYMFDYFV